MYARASHGTRTKATTLLALPSPRPLFAGTRPAALVPKATAQVFTLRPGLSSSETRRAASRSAQSRYPSPHRGARSRPAEHSLLVGRTGGLASGGRFGMGHRDDEICGGHSSTALRVARWPGPSTTPSAVHDPDSGARARAKHPSNTTSPPGLSRIQSTQVQNSPFSWRGNPDQNSLIHILVKGVYPKRAGDVVKGETFWLPPDGLRLIVDRIAPEICIAKALKTCPDMTP
ncbi:hypothetical protein E4U53_005766 [Claviceps sorghi]|nr:hypothetical protein E4U53_005766 [Claviceps sorghi]